MYIALSLFVCIIGAVIYLIASKEPNSSPHAAELGRIAYAMGLLAFLLRVVPDMLPHIVVK